MIDGKRNKAHPLYHLWNGMKARCRDPNHVGYKSYGAKGIKVCDRWLTFAHFVADVGERPEGTSLDRKRVKENYGPNNWQWATSLEQSENTTRNQYIESGGERLTISQWSRKLGIDQRTLNRRRYLGWSDHDVINRPIGEARC
jgi:hypothetical protein